MNTTENVDIQKIISEIRAEIDESSMEDLLSFDEIPIRNTPNISEARSYINANWNIPYYRDIGTSGPKGFIKRVIRKTIRCVVLPLCTDQSNLNLNMATAFNILMDQIEEQQKQIDLMKKHLVRLNNKVRFYEGKGAK